jgi:hypothetical protein
MKGSAEPYPEWAVSAYVEDDDDEEYEEEMKSDD